MKNLSNYSTRITKATLFSDEGVRCYLSAKIVLNLCKVSSPEKYVDGIPGAKYTFCDNRVNAIMQIILNGNCR